MVPLFQPVPSIRGRCWQRAARRSFFSRDNAENFITFCRDLGVHENLLFESDDLGNVAILLRKIVIILKRKNGSVVVVHPFLMFAVIEKCVIMLST